MMWKDEYKLGNELIDNQHQELFVRVAALTEIVQGDDAESHKQECINAILFLKDYALKHFAAEEAFQESLNYKFLEFHKAIHSAFVDNVLEAEAKLVAADFSIPVIKEFCGFLSMWLIYHVAGADQKIVKDDAITVAEFALTVSHEDCVIESMREVLDTILGDTLDISRTSERVFSSNCVMIEIDYDEKHIMRFLFPQQTAFSLVNHITDLELTEFDELAHAVLTQFARTICDNTFAQMSRNPQASEKIKNLQDTISDGDEYYIDTKFGCISISPIAKED